MRAFVLFSSIYLLFACGNSPTYELYHLELQIDESRSIPFLLRHDPQTEHFAILNGDEVIDGLTSSTIEDSLDLEHNVYNASLRFLINGDSLKGYWYNREKGTYSMPLRGWKADYRFSGTHKKERKLKGRWKVQFDEGEKAYPAVGIFDSKAKEQLGTFLTETGDYRYLAGIYDGDTMWLSTFDMAHAFLFTAELKGKNQLIGSFYSGHHYKVNWLAIKDAKATLTDADKLVQVVDSQPQFAVRGLSNELIDLNNPLFKDKGVIVQLFGSWCPNCYDESRHLRSLYSSLQNDSIEVLGVAFERTHELEKAKMKLEKFRSGLDIPYPLAYGGYASKDTAQAVFPFLDRIVAFPTLIFFDKNHELRAVHSGFSGPANPQAFEQTKAEIDGLIKEIIPE